ncbi:hypothetical protein CRM22_010635 [Opisthorchis felineus]|uniref:Uncharacterized protein n=2 Tax=Opisthorchis felineus TaxID=147828 RepID=A0A4S2KW85_OPIFE|nr:hypothetical protein CRM22_010635 [Opisthorchis felineus]
MNSGDESSSTSTFPLSEEEIADDNEVNTEFPKTEKYKEGDREFTPLNDDWHTCETARLDTTQSLESEAMVVRLSPDYSFCAVGLANGDIRLFHLNGTRKTGLTVRLKDPGETLPCTDIRFFHNIPSATSSEVQCILCSYASGFVRLWNYTLPSSRTALKAIWKEYVFREDENDDRGKQDANHILCLSISFDNRRFITGGKDAYIRVYEKGWSNECRLLQPKIHSFESLGHTSRITALAYHPRGKEDRRYLPIFISASWDDSIQVWHDQQGSSLWQIYGTYVAGNDGLDIDPTKNIILTCSWRRENSLVQLWPFPDFLIEGEGEITERENVSYKRPLSRFAYEPLKQVTRGYVAKFDAHYKLILYAGSNKNLVSILDIENNTVVAEVTHLDSGVYSGAVFRDPETPDQLLIIYTSGKGVSLGKINMNT